VYRLPTEAEWEYACRAGSASRFCFGDDETAFGDFAWFKDNSAGTTHPVGQKKPNGWGLYDMHGNVCEWCQDWYDPDYYKVASPGDPPGPSSGSYRVYRGGSCVIWPQICRSAYRFGGVPSYRSRNLGFRVARSLPGQ
jgi:formylglycine-generating enzyme required for sulfatase activity